MIPLPQDFISYTSALFGEERWARFLTAFEEPAPVSIRLNPWKSKGENLFASAQVVPWCPSGRWLQERPSFTLDPLFHAGVYYVQEAGSMFLDYILRQYVKTPVCALDLCAAPGGKSTLMRATLPTGSLLISNEIDRRRVSILKENLLKQGHPDVLITSSSAREYKNSNLTVDVILADVPCSGEGLFRRDKKTILEWSIANVKHCQQRQRDILSDIWSCLRPGGLFIYSTCTFNLHENEENICWMLQELDAEILPVAIPPAWQITGSLLMGWEKPVYRFIPGITHTEGFFIAVLRRKGNALPISPETLHKQLIHNRAIYTLCDRFPSGVQKGKDIIPSAYEPFCLQPAHPLPLVELSLSDALKYLNRQTLVLAPNAPRGYVWAGYKGHALGLLKNIGERANNLYPKEWAIRKL